MEALTRMANQDHGDVIASAAAGDEIAFQRIIAEHHPRAETDAKSWRSG